ncbi:19289_t:CDS:2, partial [Dentiscutata erythropus]
NLTDIEELDIKKKFIDADSIIKKTTLKSLSTLQNKDYSDVQEIRHFKDLLHSDSIFEAPSHIIDLA